MRSFGELEARIMRVVWESEDPVTAHQVLDVLSSDREVAYTTAITVIERLRRKGWLVRERDGRAYRYRATKDEGEYAASLMGQVLDEASDRSAALLRFTDQLTASEMAALRRALGEGNHA
jgi:predicted transcriptional regulator